MERRIARPKSLRSHYLALLSKSVFDIPPRIRTFLIIIGLLGIGLTLMESLVVRQGQTIALDKMIHFFGYGTLAVVFILILRPLHFIPGLIGLVGLGVGVEILQGYTFRTQEWGDIYANMLGVAVGGLLGLLVRGIYAYLSKELAVQKVKRNLLRFEPGDIILQEGRPIEDFYLIKTGTVQLNRIVNGKSKKIGAMSVGDVLGTLGVILGEPQYTTAVALDDVTLYRMDLDEMLKSAGGEELPVAMLLLSLSKNLKNAAEKLASAQIGLNDL